MKVNFDLDRGVNEIKLNEKEKNDLGSIFSSNGIILGSMLFESNCDINKLDPFELYSLIGEMLVAAQFVNNHRRRK